MTRYPSGKIDLRPPSHVNQNLCRDNAKPWALKGSTYRKIRLSKRKQAHPQVNEYRIRY